MDAIEKATAWRAEIDAEHPAVDRAAEVLAEHEYVYVGRTVEGDDVHACTCEAYRFRFGTHARHVAEQLAAAGLLHP